MRPWTTLGLASVLMTLASVAAATGSYDVTIRGFIYVDGLPVPDVTVMVMESDNPFSGSVDHLGEDAHTDVNGYFE